MGEVGDIGIDIVAEEEATGDIVGIQCKFYLPEHQLSKGDIDKFLATLGKKQFSSGIIVSTTDKCAGPLTPQGWFKSPHPANARKGGIQAAGHQHDRR